MFIINIVFQIKKMFNDQGHVPNVEESLMNKI